MNSIVDVTFTINHKWHQTMNRDKFMQWSIRWIQLRIQMHRDSQRNRGDHFEQFLSIDALRLSIAQILHSHSHLCSIHCQCFHLHSHYWLAMVWANCRQINLDQIEHLNEWIILHSTYRHNHWPNQSQILMYRPIQCTADFRYAWNESHVAWRLSISHCHRYQMIAWIHWPNGDGHLHLHLLMEAFLEKAWIRRADECSPRHPHYCPMIARVILGLWVLSHHCYCYCYCCCYDGVLWAHITVSYYTVYV